MRGIMPELEKPSPRVRTSHNSPYLFYDPHNFINKQMREWLSSSTIAHIGPLWLPLPREDRNYGGVEDVVLNNIQALENFGAKNQLIFGHPSNKRMENYITGARVFTPTNISSSVDLLEILRTDTATADRLERIYVLQAYKKIAENSDSITIVHDHSNYGRDHGIWVSKFLKPVVRTEHGPMSQPSITELEEISISQFEGNNDLGFIAISKNQMSHKPDINWIGVNYNGVNLKDFTYNEKKENFLLSLGRITRTKGIHNAIYVALKIGVPLIIAGTIEETSDSVEYFDQEIAPFIDGQNIIHLENGVNAEERKQLLEHASALLMLIEWDEPFGMVMPEAMASGTPVVGFRKGSVPEIVGKGTGFVVDSLEEAVVAIEQIIKGEYSPQLCRIRVEKLFSREAMAARNIHYYMKQEKRFNTSN